MEQNFEVIQAEKDEQELLSLRKEISILKSEYEQIEKVINAHHKKTLVEVSNIRKLKKILEEAKKTLSKTIIEETIAKIKACEVSFRASEGALIEAFEHSDEIIEKIKDIRVKFIKLRGGSAETNESRG